MKTFLLNVTAFASYIQGGRLVSERKMVSDIYQFDLETFKWEKVPQSPEDDIPQARYFHSADTCTYAALAHLITVLHFAQGGTILLSLVVWLSSPSQTTRKTFVF